MGTVTGKRLMIAGTGSGCGKTTAVCAILYGLKKQGFAVEAWKSGPDYIDPMFHRRVLGSTSGNLDLYFSGADGVRRLLAQRIDKADIGIVEGAMGYYDGIGMTGRAGCHELAEAAGLPVVLVVSPQGMGNSVGALLQGFLQYRQPSHIAGVLFNRVSASRYEQLRPLAEKLGLRAVGYLPVQEAFAPGSRHLGLITADEIENFQGRLAQFYQIIKDTIDWRALTDLADSAPPVTYADAPSAPSDGMESLRIGVAQDEAFCFVYEDNLRWLRRKGCQLVPFSPLRDQRLPANLDGMILCGGYPELYAGKLSANKEMRKEIREAFFSGLPCIAECGGFLYLQKSLTDGQGCVHEMAGVFPGHAFGRGGLERFGYISLSANGGRVFGEAEMPLRAHEFHYYDCDRPGSAFLAQKASGTGQWLTGEAGDHFYAGFPHIYFESNETFAEGFLARARYYRERHGYVSVSHEPYTKLGREADQSAREAAQTQWDAVAKPLRGLGRLEDMIVRIAGIQGNHDIAISKRAVLVFCADNGITAQGVTQTDSHVTALVAGNIAEGTASVSRMCAQSGTDVYAIDIGIRDSVCAPSMLSRRIAAGTRDFSQEPAMSREQAVRAIETGIDLVKEYRERGYTILATGEMGIGNTTTASAMAAALLPLSPEQAAGRGAGLSDEGLARKRAVIEDALRRYRLRERNPLEVLSHVGGFDIAGMTGAFIGGCMYGVPIVIDGMISAVAALTASLLCERAVGCMLASHRSREPAMAVVMERLGLVPVIDGDLALGEGTGAALLFPMLDMAERVYRNTETFEKMQIESYRKYD